MNSVVNKAWKQGCAVVLLVSIDLAISLPIMGATYRPFSWMSIAPADAATLYPVIRNMTLHGDRMELEIQAAPGARYAVQRSTNLADAASWNDVSTVVSTNPVMVLIDTNPVMRAVYYRVKTVLASPP